MSGEDQSQIEGFGGKIQHLFAFIDVSRGTISGALDKS